jgi:sec-independent protein translocase protein TatC
MVGMGFLDHLEELRLRILRCCIAVAVGMIGAFAFIGRIVEFMLAPTRRMLPPGTALIYTEPGEAFGLYVEVAMIAGALLAAPYLMFQVWRFIAPGLYAREKRLAVPFVLLMTLGMRVVFQIPTLAFFLARMRVVTARFMWRNFQYAFLLIFIIAAVLTPSTDGWNQTVFAAPMVVLYLLSILIVWAAYPRA